MKISHSCMPQFYSRRLWQWQPAPTWGYYQPAGPLISTHHHHHHSSSSSVVNTGKAPAVLTTLESSATPTPPPSASASHATSSGTTRGGGTGGDESSDNDVIITATSCSSAGEVAPPPSLTQPPPPSAAHHTSYRYAQSSYPPPPTPSTPQHPLHQSYSYNYPHTQYYPSPPSSASIQYSSVVSNPQHHSHYHNQDLCYSGAASNYPPASYFHHKSYSTPPPPPSYRRYIPAPPPHHSQYYPPDLYSAPSSGSVGQQQSQSQQQQQQGSQQQQQSQQMVVTASTGAVSSYQPPPPAPPAPPALVETYPPPPSIVDPYPPPYYTSYSAGPGAPGCYTHSPPTRSLAFIDAPYQSCPCPMQSCPKNVLTGPLTGDGKGPHTKQPQQHVPPLPPVALALPLEPPGAMGPPSPARGSAGMPPPPSPASASARTDDQSKPSGSLTVLSSATEDAIVNNGDGLLTISKMNSSPVPPPTTVLHCDTEVTTKMKQSAVAVKVDSSEPTQTSDSDLLQQKTQDIVTQTDFPVVLGPKENSVKVETSSSPEVEVLPVIDKSSPPPQLPSSGEGSTQTAVLSSSSPTSRKRQLSSDASPPKSAASSAVTKRRKTSSSSGGASAGEELPQDSVVETIESEQHPPEDTASKTSPKCPPVLSSNGSNISVPLSSAKQRKRKLEDGSKSWETAPTPAKVISRVQSSEAKTYPSRTKPVKNGKTSNSKLTAPEALDRILHKNQTVCDPATAAVLKKNGISVGKKLPNGKILSKKALEKANGSLCHQPLKKVLRQLSAQQPDSDAVCVNGHVVAQMMSNGNNGKNCTEKAGHRRKALEASAARKSNKSNNMLRRQSLREPSPDQISEEGVEVETSKVKARRLSSGSKKETSTAKKTASVVSSSKVNGEVRSSAKKQQLLQQQLQDLVMPTTHPDIYAMKKTMMKKPLPTLKWSNGWSWEGEPFWARVFLTSDDVAGARKCYPAMRHTEGDVIRPRDCVLLKSGPRKTDLPFVAKVAGLWENPDDGEMMVSLLWYYRPEHTDQGRRPEDMEDEIFASKHKDINSVACIEDKCYVLTFNEYCRYRKCVRRLEEGVREPGLVVPEYEGYPRRSRQPPGRVASDMVFFCRRVYDFRQRRILKNPG